LFTGQIAGGRVELQTEKLQATRTRAAEALDGQREALIGMVGDGQDAASEVVLLRPQMQ
jgi:hypothetical protein